MTESDMYQKIIKPDLSRKGIFLFRVEHARLPDVYASKNGNAVWLELKVINKKNQKVLKPDWRIGQISWIREQKLKGGVNNVWLGLWYDNKVLYLDPKEIYNLEDIKCQKKIFLQHLNRQKFQLKDLEK